jgi:hypothetical protein
VSTSDTVDYSPSLVQIMNAWPHLPPHIREAICTLVDAAMPSVDAVNTPHTNLQM